MTTLKLYKQHQCIQLAHLYEHMYINAVFSYLYNLEIYRGIDYDLSGSTFDSGIIEIEFTPHTDRASSQLSELSKVDVSIDKTGEGISKALNQILAEEPYKLFITSHEEVMKELELLQSHPWQTTKPNSQTKQSVHPIYLTDEPQDDKKSLTIQIKAEEEFIKNNQDLIKITSEWSRLPLIALSSIVSVKYGLYRGEIKVHSDQITTSQLHISPLNPYNLDTEAINKELIQSFKEINSEETVQRFINSQLSTTPELAGKLTIENLQLINQHLCINSTVN